MVCDNLGVEHDADNEEDASGNSFVRRMTSLGNLVRERVRGALHHGVKRALAVVRSVFEYDMGLVADGFTSDTSKSKEENEAACLGLIEAVEEPGVDSRGCLRTRCSRLLPVPMMRAYEPKLGKKAHVIS
jgi:hypothetical protein